MTKGRTLRRTVRAPTRHRAVVTTSGFDRTSRGKSEWLVELQGEDARTIHFPVKIAKDGESIVRYKVRYTW